MNHTSSQKLKVQESWYPNFFLTSTLVFWKEEHHHACALDANFPKSVQILLEYEVEREDH